MRTRQAFAKHCDLAMYRIGVSACDRDSPHQPGLTSHFFFENKGLQHILSSLWELLPQTAEQIVERAEEICRHRFDLLGYEGVAYGSEIDWHLDAVHGKRAPMRPWFRVPYLDFVQVGDSKVTWELNRHQHLVTLAKAYRLTGEVRYTEELFRQWYHWHEQNPYPMGINWASSLEVAFRSLSWLWAWHLVDGCPALPQEFPFDLSQALGLNARHIKRFLSTYFSPNTHILGEGVGLFFIGTLCPGLPSAAAWQECGWQIILNEAERQVHPDGLHFEQSMYYHTYALDFFLHSRILAALNHVPVPPVFEKTIEKMLEVTSALATLGHVPQFGDDDGGRVFDAKRNRPEHTLDPLSIGAVLYNRPDFKAQANQITEELLWLLGTRGVKQFKELPDQKQPETSLALEASGIYVMRSSGPASYQLLVDAGPQGAGRSGHGHADALSVQLSGNGKALLIDAGTFTYADSCGERDWFRGTAAHNTVRVDDSSQAAPEGPFEWSGRANATVSSWVTGKSFDFLAASHTGYFRLSSPVRHRRCIFHLKSRFWAIYDVLEGTELHELEVSWHFAPGCLRAIPGGALFVSDELSPLALLFAADRSCKREVSNDWYSPVYGRKELSPTFRLRTNAALPTEFITMLIPDSEVAAHLGLLRQVQSGIAGVPVKSFRYSTFNAEDHLFFADGTGNWRVGPWASDAAFLYCSIDSRKTVRQFVICGGRYFELNGRRIFGANLPVKQSEWSRDACESVTLNCFDSAVSQEPPKKDKYLQSLYDPKPYLRQM
ncbi:MAG TPA: alginate lyase family protein [Candidatus Acidoferrum sp.]|nr:alginate lyase family protein [Candidatus Acidoferrum sp.]